MIDSNRTARIADFGLTSLLRHPSISISVTPPLGRGTYRWLAPELFDGELRPSRESDIYALGMVIYEVCHCIPRGVGPEGLMYHSHIGFRTRTAIFPHFPLRCTYTGPHWKTTFTTDKPGHSRAVRGYLDANGKVLDPGSKHPALGRGHPVPPRDGFS